MLIKKIISSLLLIGLNTGLSAYEFSDLPYDESHDYVFDKVFSASFGGHFSQIENVSESGIVFFVKGWRRVASPAQANGFISDTLTLFVNEFYFNEWYGNELTSNPERMRNCQNQVNLVKAAPHKWDLLIRVNYRLIDGELSTVVENMYCEAINQETTLEYYTALEQQPAQVTSQSRRRR